MPLLQERPATLEDLYQVEGKAELVQGRIITFMPTGEIPALIGGNIYASLREWCLRHGKGRAYPDGVGYTGGILRSGRRTFAPDASMRLNPAQTPSMKFAPGTPTFAVEVRSEYDYGRAAEAAMAEKRADYFEAGTEVVWDVDPEAMLIRSYRYDRPAEPEVFGSGEIANAEPAAPGWTVEVDEVFRIQL